MRYKVLQALSYKGDRIERGDILDIDPVEAERYGSDLIPLVSVKEPVEEGPVQIPENLDAMKKEELVELASKLGLSVGGTKSDLIERIELSAK